MPRCCLRQRMQTRWLGSGLSWHFTYLCTPSRHIHAFATIWHDTPVYPGWKAAPLSLMGLAASPRSSAAPNRARPGRRSVQCRCPVQRGGTPVSLIAVRSRSLAPAPHLLANLKTTTVTEQPRADSEAFRTDDELTTSGDAGEAC